MADDLPPLLLEEQISRDFLAAIGVFIIQFSMLEFVITCAVAQLIAGLGNDRIPSVIAVTGMEIRVKLGVLKSLVYLRFGGNAEKEFGHWQKETEAIADQRHIVAHSFWMPGTLQGEYRSAAFKTVGSLKVAQGDISAKDLKQWAARAHQAGDAIGEIFTKHGSQPAWLEKVKPKKS